MNFTLVSQYVHKLQEQFCKPVENHKMHRKFKNNQNKSCAKIKQ